MYIKLVVNGFKHTEHQYGYEKKNIEISFINDICAYLS